MEFLCSFLRRYFAGKPPMASPNFVCFLRLSAYRFQCTWSLMEYQWHCKAQEHAENKINMFTRVHTFSHTVKNFPRELPPQCGHLREVGLRLRDSNGRRFSKRRCQPNTFFFFRENVFPAKSSYHPLSSV